MQETIKDFERNLTDMVDTFIENIQALTAKCRELEDQHHEQLDDICVRLLNKVVKSELNDDLTEELQQVIYFSELSVQVFISIYPAFVIVNINLAHL